VPWEPELRIGEPCRPIWELVKLRRQIQENSELCQVKLVYCTKKSKIQKNINLLSGLGAIDALPDFFL